MREARPKEEGAPPPTFETLPEAHRPLGFREVIIPALVEVAAGLGEEGARGVNSTLTDCDAPPCFALVSFTTAGSEAEEPERFSEDAIRGLNDVLRESADLAEEPQVLVLVTELDEVVGVAWSSPVAERDDPALFRSLSESVRSRAWPHVRETMRASLIALGMHEDDVDEYLDEHGSDLLPVARSR
jgi:hypothetical protein